MMGPVSLFYIKRNVSQDLIIILDINVNSEIAAL